MRRSEIDRDQNLESEHRHFLAIRFRLVAQHTDFNYDSHDAEQLQIIWQKMAWDARYLVSVDEK